MFRSLSERPWMASVSVAAAAISVAAMANAAEPLSEDTYNRCRAISDDRARLLCFEALTPPDPQKAPAPVPTAPHGAEGIPDVPPGLPSESESGSSSTAIAGKWRLVHTADPRAGRERKDIVSIMTPAELSGSDTDFAGLGLRCAGADFEVLIFLLSPLRLQARPAITIDGRSLQGNVVSPGTAILLSKDASDLARQQWLALPNLSVEVENDSTKIHGFISLDGFNTALQRLMETCSTR